MLLKRHYYRGNYSYLMTNNIILIITIIGSPLFFCLWIYDYFLLEKSILIQSLILFSLLLFVVKGIKDNTFRFKISPSFYPLLLFFFTALLSLFQGYNLSEKLRAVFRISMFGGLFLVVANNVNFKKYYKLFFIASISTGFVVSLYALFQYFGFDILIKGNKVPCSSLGNTNLLAEYLVCIIPLYFYLFKQSSLKKEKFFLLASLLVILAAVILTHSRGAWIALIISFLVILGLIHKHLSVGRIVLFAAFLLLVVFIVDFGFLGATVINNFPSLFNHEYLSNSFRVNVWLSAWQMVLDNPLSGVGVNNFHVIYPLYRTSTEQNISGIRVTVQRVHNDFLQIMVELGILGFLFFVWFIGGVYKKALLFLKDSPDFNEDKTAMVSLMGGITALLLLAVYSFPLQTPVSSFYFWFFLGAVVNISIPQNYEKSFTLSRMNKAALLTGTSLVVFLLSLWLTKPLLASYYMKEGENHRLKHQFRQAALDYTQAINIYAGNREAYLYKAQALQELGSMEQAVEFYTKALNLYPYCEPTHAFLGSIFSAKGLNEEAKKEFEIALKLNPLRSEAYTKLGYIYLKERNYHKAESLFKTGKELNLEDEYARLGLAYLLQERRDIEGALAEYKKILEINPQRADVYNNLGILYAEQNKLKQAKEMWKKAVAMDTQFVEARKNLKKISGE